MKVGELIKRLQNLVLESPEIEQLPILLSIDSEGNGFHKLPDNFCDYSPE